MSVATEYSPKRRSQHKLGGRKGGSSSKRVFLKFAISLPIRTLAEAKLEMASVRTRSLSGSGEGDGRFNRKHKKQHNEGG